MSGNVAEPQTALKYETEVREHGRVELHVPLAAGARVIVFVIPNSRDTFSDLVAATPMQTHYSFVLTTKDLEQ